MRRILLALAALGAVLVLSGDAQAQTCSRQWPTFYVNGDPGYGSHGQGLGVLVCNRDAKETPPAQH